MRRALADAGLTPDEVDVVFADGAGVARPGRAEAAAIRAVFGGRARGAGDRAAEDDRPAVRRRLRARVATALLAIRDGSSPPSATSTSRARYGLDLVRTPAGPDVGCPGELARGYGGFNSCDRAGWRGAP